MKKSIAEEFDHNFEINSFKMFDVNNNDIYFEDSTGFWVKRTFDNNHNAIHYINSIGFWGKYKFDGRNLIHFENSAGYWGNFEYDDNNNIIHTQTSEGYHVKQEDNKQINSEIIHKKSIAEEFNHDFDTDGPFKIFDDKHNQIYYETMNGFWVKRKFSTNKVVYYEDSKGEKITFLTSQLQ